MSVKDLLEISITLGFDFSNLNRLKAPENASKEVKELTQNLENLKREREIQEEFKRLQNRNLVKEVHDKLIKYLCTNYSLILLPVFQTQKMIARKTRRIKNKTARSLITWSHFSFRQRLTNKLKEYKEV